MCSLIIQVANAIATTAAETQGVVAPKAVSVGWPKLTPVEKSETTGWRDVQLNAMQLYCYATPTPLAHAAGSTADCRLTC